MLQSFVQFLLRYYQTVLVCAINDVYYRLEIHQLVSNRKREEKLTREHDRAYVGVCEVVGPRLTKSVLPADVPAEKA